MDLIRCLFDNFEDYLKLINIEKNGDVLVILFEYIEFANIDKDIDIDEEYYYRVIDTIGMHFKIYSKELLSNTMNSESNITRVKFDSSFKKIIYENSDDYFSTTIIEKK